MSDIQESKITDEHRARIGVKTEPAETVIREADARRVRDLLGDDDPRYADGTGIAPPYVIAVLDPGVPRGLMPQIMPGGILTQTEWRFHKPLRIGATLKLVHSLVDIRDRLGGRYGYSVIVMTETEYIDEQGELVASSFRTVTQFDRGNAQE